MQNRMAELFPLTFLALVGGAAFIVEGVNAQLIPGDSVSGDAFDLLVRVIRR